MLFIYEDYYIFVPQNVTRIDNFFFDITVSNLYMWARNLYYLKSAAFLVYS